MGASEKMMTKIAECSPTVLHAPEVRPTAILLFQRIVTDLVDVLVGLDEVDAELAQGCGGRVSEVLGDARLHGLNVRWGVRACQLLLVHQPPVQHRMSSAHTNALSGCKRHQQHTVRKTTNFKLRCCFYLPFTYGCTTISKSIIILRRYRKISEFTLEEERY